MEKEKEIAIELVKSMAKELDKMDAYWNITENAKDCSMIACNILLKDDSVFRCKVIAEIEKLPEFIEDFN